MNSSMISNGAQIVGGQHPGMMNSQQQQQQQQLQMQRQQQEQPNNGGQSSRNKVGHRNKSSKNSVNGQNYPPNDQMVQMNKQGYPPQKIQARSLPPQYPIETIAQVKLPNGAQQNPQVLDQEENPINNNMRINDDRTTIHNNIIININNTSNNNVALPERRKSPSMQSDRGVSSNRMKDLSGVQVQLANEKAKMRKTDTEFNSSVQSIKNQQQQQLQQQQLQQQQYSMEHSREYSQPNIKKYPRMASVIQNAGQRSITVSKSLSKKHGSNNYQMHIEKRLPAQHQYQQHPKGYNSLTYASQGKRKIFKISLALDEAEGPNIMDLTNIDDGASSAKMDNSILSNGYYSQQDPRKNFSNSTLGSPAKQNEINSNNISFERKSTGQHTNNSMAAIYQQKPIPRKAQKGNRQKSDNFSNSQNQSLQKEMAYQQQMAQQSYLINQSAYAAYQQKFVGPKINKFVVNR